jgi:predicted esterase
MRRIEWTMLPCVIAAALIGAAAQAADVGVVPTKLIVVDKLSSAGKAKAVFVSKDSAAGISKGSGTDIAQISVQFDAAYVGTSVAGAFALPAGASDGTSGWLVNKAAVAKFVNKAAPNGTTQAKVGVIKPGKLLKLVAKGTGDTPFDVLAAGPPPAGVRTSYCVMNGGDETCHCSEFPTCAWKSIAGGTGAKLVCKGGVADPTCGPTVKEPILPEATQPCPTIVDGNVTFLGRSIRIWVDPDAAQQDGPIVFMWHGLGGSPSQLLLDVMLSAAGRTEILAQGGLIAGMRADPASTSPFLWTNADMDIADEILACAIEQVGIDTTRIHSVGVSAGALQTSFMSYFRSGYLASVVSYSGGATATTDQDPDNKLAAMVLHGGDGDIFILNFKTQSQNYFNDLISRGRFAMICDHGIGHTIPLDIGDDAWRFLQDHPYGVSPPFPYAGGIPGTYPSYCSLTIP